MPEDLSNTAPPTEAERLTAIHEAGHAVMAELCGRQVTEVEIVGDGEHTGMVHSLAFPPDGTTPQSETKDIELQLKVILAGTVAEAMVSGRKGWDETSEDVDAAVDAAHAALEGAWGRMAAAERGRLLVKLGEAVLEDLEVLAGLEARDTGKPLTQGRADIKATARYFEFYGGAADKVHGATLPYQDGMTVFTLREPPGVTGHIIPWNYPAQILGRSIGAALAMGNAAVVKPAEDACLSILRIAQLAMDVGFPDGALNVVTGLERRRRQRT